MLEKNFLYGFYGFWIFVGACCLFLYGFSSHTLLHLYVVWGVSLLGIYCAKYKYDIGYVCLGVTLFYFYWQVKYFNLREIIFYFTH